MTNVQSLADRLHSVLSVYYDWVQVSVGEDGSIHIRVGKRHPTDRDLDEFMLRVNGEIKDGKVISDVELRKEEGEITGVVADTPSPDEASDGLVKKLREFAGEALSIVEDDRLDLSRLHENVRVKAAYVTVDCPDLRQAEEKVRLIRKFLEGNGFSLVCEGEREDAFVSREGVLAETHLFVIPSINPTVRLAVYIPKSVTEANLIRRHFGLSEVVFVEPEVAREVAREWDRMTHEERLDFLLRKAALKRERAEVWARHSFEEILDMHPFLAQRMAREMVGVRVE
jgi:hypothetical protein